jgi:hypothetical protein
MSGGGMPDFSKLYSSTPEPAATEDTTSKQGSTSTMPDFNSLYAPEARSQRQINIDHINSLKSEFYDNIGLKNSPALRGLVDLIPGFVVKALGTTGADVSSAVGSGAQGIGDVATGLYNHPIDTIKKLGEGAVEGLVTPFV